MVQAPQIPGASYEEGDAGGMTVFLWGHPGVWKTTWAAQWPGVVFISIAAEGGDDALLIRTIAQLLEAVEYVCRNHKQTGICTVCIDGLNYLIDLWIDEYIQHAEKHNPGWTRRVKKQGGDILGPPEWGLLNMFLRSLRVKMNNEGLNIIWTTLQQDMFKSNPNNMAEQTLEKSLPMLKGQNRITLPAACKLHIHAERIKIAHPSAMGRMTIQPTFWTASTNYVDLRHKYLWKFPQGCLVDPEFGTTPTFRAVWYELHEFIYVGKR
jgi:hypothetical protein